MVLSKEDFGCKIKIKKKLLKSIPSDWKNFDAVICKKINLGKPKLSKVFKGMEKHHRVARYFISK